MEDVIKSVTTPLALAALIVLVVGGVYQARNKNRAYVSKQAFWLILAFGLMGNAGYIFQTLLFSEAVFLGNVRDSTGSAVRFAVVDVPGVGRTATSDDGSFSLTVPYSRQRGNYSVFVSANGFSNLERSVSGPGFVDLRLAPHRIALEDILDLRDFLTVTQNAGDPYVVSSFNREMVCPFRIIFCR